MKKYMLFVLSGLLTTSCIDTMVFPDDVKVAEDMWQTKEDVSAMVASAYKAMSDEAVIERCIVWGGFRSEELNPISGTFGGNKDNLTKENSLKDIKAGNMTQTNWYANWAAFYSVINKCNLVLERAPEVINIDPAYTEGTLNTDRSQMLALRSLCYFYLVRAFRDVPVTSRAYTSSTQEYEIPQQAPLTVLDKCVADLEEAMKTPLSPSGFTDWRRVGYFNKESIAALLADVYLWRASMTHNQADYQKCVEYCDVVLASKKQIYSPESGNWPTFGQRKWPNLIYNGSQLYNYIFVFPNQQTNSMISAESILELQLDGRNTSNTGLRNCYWSYDGKTSSTGLMRAMLTFQSIGDVFVSEKDYRYYECCYDIKATDKTELDVFKMVSPSGAGNSDNSSSMKVPTGGLGRDFTNVNQNWIVYRLSDVMLMKAEALVQLAPDAEVLAGDDDVAEEDNKLLQAFLLVNEVNKRSIAKDPLEDADTLKLSAYNTKADMEELVLAERFRELCFEGKRFFDLVRYSYRHVDGIQPDKILAEIGEDPKAMVPNYQEMMTKMTRGMSEGSTAAVAKMRTEPYLYFPVLESELNANFSLKQNPAYKKNDSYVKN